MGNAKTRLIQLKHLPAEIIKINSNCLSCLDMTDARDKKDEPIPIPVPAYSCELPSDRQHSARPAHARSAREDLAILMRECRLCTETV